MIILSNRRRRFQPNYNLDTLTIVKRVLQILILIFLLIFIFSSIKMKKNLSKQNILADNINNSETNENTQIATYNENNLNLESNSNSEDNQSQEQKNESKNTTINMAFTGDIMCHNTIYKDAYNSDNETYNFSYLFDEIKYNIQTADISIGNLETTFSGSSKKKSVKLQIS